MHDKHAPHGPTGIIKHPLAPIAPVLVEPDVGVFSYEGIKQRIDNEGRILRLTQLLRVREGVVDGGFELGEGEAVEVVLLA